jgi:hypothetical protein
MIYSLYTSQHLIEGARGVFFGKHHLVFDPGLGAMTVNPLVDSFGLVHAIDGNLGEIDFVHAVVGAAVGEEDVVHLDYEGNLSHFSK